MLIAALLLLQDKANLERQLKQLNSRSSMLEKNLEKKDTQVGAGCCAILRVDVPNTNHSRTLCTFGFCIQK